jgi:hypothetical protein
MFFLQEVLNGPHILAKNRCGQGYITTFQSGPYQRLKTFNVVTMRVMTASDITTKTIPVTTADVVARPTEVALRWH